MTADEPLERRAVQRGLAPHRGPAEQEVRRLLDVGLQLMVTAGPRHQPRLTDIIRAAGMSNDAFYRYFAGKDDLVAAIVDDGSRRLLSHVRHQLAKSPDPAAQLRLAMEAVVKQAADAEVAGTTRAVLRNASIPRAAGSTFGTQLTAELATIFAGPLGELGTPDPDRDARALAVTVFATMEHFLWNEQAPAEADLDHLFRFLLHAVGGPGADRSGPTDRPASSAREAISDLVIRYNTNGDSGRFEAVAALFTPDGVLQLPDGSSYTGHDDIVGAFTALRDRASGGAGPRYLRHMLATHQIDLDEDGYASGRAYYQVLTSVGLDHWGRYVDEYRATDGRWQFTHRRVTVDGNHPASELVP